MAAGMAFRPEPFDFGRSAPCAQGRRSRRTNGALLLLALTLAPSAARAAEPTVPVRVRIIRGSREGPPSMDPRLKDLQAQLGRLAYQRWEEVGEHSRVVAFKKPVDFPLPDGSVLTLTLEDARKDTVTFQVAVPARRTRSRLTISKDQRIVHQVTDEKDGAAYFASVRPWP
jgi:hypothetical protein